MVSIQMQSIATLTKLFQLDSDKIYSSEEQGERVDKALKLDSGTGYGPSLLAASPKKPTIRIKRLCFTRQGELFVDGGAAQI